jgi:hypothetical protein
MDHSGKTETEAQLVINSDDLVIIFNEKNIADSTTVKYNRFNYLKAVSFGN